MEGFFKKLKNDTDKKLGLGGNANNNNNKKDGSSGGGGGGGWTGGNNLNDSSFASSSSSKSKPNRPTPKPLSAARKNPFEKNPFANIGKSKKFQGGGQSLGGAKPGRVINVVIQDDGPIGLKVEKRSIHQPTAIVAMVVPGGQADTAKIQRGDIVCHPGSDGLEEIMYDQFLAMAASNRRPLVFDVRRVDGVGGKKSAASEAAASRAGATTTTGGKNKSISSAEAYARKQAVIAAAEARDRAHKAKTKPVAKKKNVDRLPSNVKSGDTATMTSNEEETNNEPQSEESRKAVEDAKRFEAEHAAQLGYNPYETARMGAGQARTATVAMTHGTMNAGAEEGVNNVSEPSPSTAAVAPNAVTPPSNPVQPSEEVDNADSPINPAFDEAYTNIILSSSSQSTTVSSFSIMRKLIVNATTKGQKGDDASSAKFRRVRLSNPKIAAAITNVPGALELMLSVGFVLSENTDDGETYLVYPPGEKGPDWLEKALKRMELYENGGATSGTT